MKNKRLYLGAAYYPEVWHFSDEIIAEDITYLKKGGFNLVRMAEFAWSTMEPRDGVFEFDEFYAVVDRMYQNGIYTILCTPSATPPSWLTLRNEETLVMTDNGQRFQHGSRRHGCSNSPILRKYTARIVTEMAKKFAQHPGVVGWQIDNEIYPHIRDVVGNPDRGCVCPVCMESFHKRLEGKFGTVEEMNRAWYLRLWSQEYYDFKDVPPPHNRTWVNPSLVTEWNNFRSDSNVEFVSLQANALRKGGVTTPIGTDMMPMGGQSYTETNRTLDVVQFNHYHSSDNLWEVCFWYDYIRDIKPDMPFWVMETDFSYAGSTATHGYQPPGYTRINSILPYAMGGAANCYWLWRAHPAGQELMFGGVINSHGRPQYNFDEGKEISTLLQCGESLFSGTVVKNSGFAMTYSGKAWTMFEGQAVSGAMKYQPQINAAYGVLLRANIRPSVIDEEGDLTKYKVIYSPFMPCIEEYGFAAKITKWMENGGIWLAGPLTDIRNPHGVKYEKAPTGHIEKLTGAYLKYGVPMRNNADDVDRAISGAYAQPLIMSAAKIKWDINGLHETNNARLWADAYEIPDYCQPLGTYESGPLAGLTAAFFAPVGEKGGGIIVLGTNPTEQTLVHLINYAFIKKGLEKGIKTSANVLAIERTAKDSNRTAGMIVLEIGMKDGYVLLPQPMKDIVTGKVLKGRVDMKPYTVLLLESE
jgi:beta-galactosidase GanA